MSHVPCPRFSRRDLIVGVVALSGCAAPRLSSLSQGLAGRLIRYRLPDATLSLHRRRPAVLEAVRQGPGGTGATYMIAALDPGSAQVLRLASGPVAPCGPPLPTLTLTWLRESGRLELSRRLPDGGIRRESLAAPPGRWFVAELGLYGLTRRDMAGAAMVSVTPVLAVAPLPRDLRFDDADGLVRAARGPGLALDRLSDGAPPSGRLWSSPACPPA